MRRSKKRPERMDGRDRAPNGASGLPQRLEAVSAAIDSVMPITPLRERIARRPQVFWITMLGNWIALLRARSESRAAALRAIAR